MLTQRIHQALIQLLMLIIISQVALMTVSSSPFKYFSQSTTPSAYTPCTQSNHTQLSTSKFCDKQGADAFVNVDKTTVILMRSPMNIFLALTLIFAYATPIYSIDKPPKY